MDLDNSDPLSYLKKTFHTPKTKTGNPYIYLCGHSLGLQPNSVYNIVNEELEAWKRYGVEGHHYGKRPWIPYHQLLTQYSAELVGALEKEVVVMNSLTVNLHLLMASFYQPKGRKKKILIENNAFPSDYYAVQSQLKFHNNHPIDDLIILQSNDGLVITTDIIEEYFEQYGDEISMVMIGGVNYYSGQVFDIKTITKKAHQYGCLVGFDLAHSTGNVLLSLHNWGVDFATWCGYKYLNGGPGAPAYVYVAQALQADVRSPLTGWMGHESPFDFSPHYTRAPGIRQMLCGSPPILSMVALEVGVDLLLEVDLAEVRRKSIQLTDLFMERVDERCREQHFTILTPREPKYRGSQVALAHTHGSEIIEAMFHHGVVADFRPPDLLRFGFAPLYTRYTDVWDAVETLSGIVEEGTWSGA